MPQSLNWHDHSDDGVVLCPPCSELKRWVVGTQDGTLYRHPQDVVDNRVLNWRETSVLDCDGCCEPLPEWAR